MAVEKAGGQIGLLRINDHGGYGPADDFLDAELIVKFKNDSRAFGLALKPNEQLPAAQAMTALLEDAFNANAMVQIEFEVRPGHQNHYFFRVIRTA